MPAFTPQSPDAAVQRDEAATQQKTFSEAPSSNGRPEGTALPTTFRETRTRRGSFFLALLRSLGSWHA